VWESAGTVPLSENKRVRLTHRPPLRKEPPVPTEWVAGGGDWSSFGSLRHGKTFIITDRRYVHAYGINNTSTRPVDKRYPHLSVTTLSAGSSRQRWPWPWLEDTSVYRQPVQPASSSDKERSKTRSQINPEALPLKCGSASLPNALWFPTKKKMLFEGSQASPACLSDTVLWRWRWIYSIGGMILRGENRITGRKTCLSATLSKTNHTSTSPGSDIDLRPSDWRLAAWANLKTILNLNYI
jgi:hypothetical protein